jgi:lactobin A/cerein 7B family class IIb bacteriocin
MSEIKTTGFAELNENEMFEVEGGGIGIAVAVVVTAVATARALNRKVY